MPILAARQGALTGVTQGASDAASDGYSAIQDATAGLSKGQIAGAIIAIVIGFVLIVVMLWYFCIRRPRANRANDLSTPLSMKQQNSRAGNGMNRFNSGGSERTLHDPVYDFSRIGRGSRVGPRPDGAPIARGGGGSGTFGKNFAANRSDESLMSESTIALTPVPPSRNRDELEWGDGRSRGGALGSSRVPSGAYSATRSA